MAPPLRSGAFEGFWLTRAATEVAAPLVRPHHTRPAVLAAGSLHHPQHTEGPAREVHTGGRSSALRTESCASTSRQGEAPRRSKREIFATPYHRRGSNRSAYWACAGQRQGRRKRARRTTRPLRRRLALRGSGGRSTPPNSCRPRCLRHCAPMAPKASLLWATFTHQTRGIWDGPSNTTRARVRVHLSRRCHNSSVTRGHAMAHSATILAGQRLPGHLATPEDTPYRGL
jgi:hypothetical protein